MCTLTHPKYTTLIQTASTSFFFFLKNYSFYHLPYTYIRLTEFGQNIYHPQFSATETACRGHTLSEAPNEKGSGMGNSPRLFHGEHHHHKEFIKFPCNGLIFLSIPLVPHIFWQASCFWYIWRNLLTIEILISCDSWENKSKTWTKLHWPLIYNLPELD